jgi:hypothetical protein
MVNMVKAVIKILVNKEKIIRKLDFSKIGKK